jgi:hypothetical protein
MSRKILLLLALAMVLVVGWFALRSTAYRQSTDAETKEPSLVGSQAFLRYQQCQPRHWRYLMLQH